MGNIILDTPIKLANEYFSTSMNLMNQKNIIQAVKEMDKAKDKAMEAYQYAIEQNKWKHAIHALKIKVSAITILLSVDSERNTVIPFPILTRAPKKTIAEEILKYVKVALEIP